MTVEQLKQIESRHLRRQSASSRRLTRENLEMSIDIDHETTTRLPLVAAETLGIGLGFDRLYFVDLQTGEQRALPSRYELTKAVAKGNAGIGTHAQDSLHDMCYRGVEATGRYAPSDQRFYNQPLSFTDVSAHGMFHTRARDAGNFNQQAVPASAATGSWSTLSNDVFVTAYAGNGRESGNKPKNPTIHTAIVAPCFDAITGGDQVNINFDELFRLTQANGDLKDFEDLAGLTLLYQYLSPSAWNTVESNQDVIREFSLAVKDIERTLDAVYNRGRSHYGVRNTDAGVHKLIISLIELGAAMRTKRFSNNIYTGNMSSVGMTNLERFNIVHDGELGDDGVGVPWTKGVINDFFWVINNRFLIAPYWCVEQLNFFDFVDDEREKERRDIDRKDAIETLHLIFQHMETEKGLHHGSDSTLPMLLFDKFKEGVLKDFSDFTSPQAALAAAMMGYRTPRDADNNVQSADVGHVGYFATLPSAHGMLLGSEKAEFLDRITEAGEHAMMTSNVDMFKEGMQLASSFSYQAMLGRTRFGDAHTDYQVYPGGWFRGNQVTIQAYNLSDGGGTVREYPVLNIRYFPLMGWTMYAAGCSAEGVLPSRLAGADYTRGMNDIATWATCSDNAYLDRLFPESDTGESYWQPGRDNYSALLLKGTNDLYRTWMDRADTIATEGVTVPSFGTVNLVAEMSYDTPHALLTRNFPILRKLYQQAGMSSVITANDNSFDFMSAGDNLRGLSEWNGSTPWALTNRDLFNPESHPRNGQLDIIPCVYTSSSLPESWVDVFQLRDWMRFHTFIDSEPIMDAITRNRTGNSTQNNGYINSRLVVYVDEVERNGDVRDVTCTPIVGSFRLKSETRHGNLSGYFDLNVTEPFSLTTGLPDDPDLITLYPTQGEAYEYEVFLLDITRVRTERTVAGRRVSNAVHLSSNLGHDGASAPNQIFVNQPLSEADFVPGRGYALRWVTEAFAAQDPPVVVTDWATAFSANYAGATQAGLDYLGPDIGVMADAGFVLSGGTQFTLSNNGLVHWIDLMGRFIENAREGLEYKSAGPSFTVFDKDILDITESNFRMMLAPHMMSTVGPLTFVGTMDASGASQSSDSITGQSRFEVISLNTGAGTSAMDDAEPDAEQEAAGDSNPTVEVAEKPEVE